ncbi:hypothetical protein ACFX14_034538 [Malus domestica]
MTTAAITITGANPPGTTKPASTTLTRGSAAIHPPSSTIFTPTETKTMENRLLISKNNYFTSLSSPLQIKIKAHLQPPNTTTSTTPTTTVAAPFSIHKPIDRNMLSKWSPTESSSSKMATSVPGANGSSLSLCSNFIDVEQSPKQT